MVTLGSWDYDRWISFVPTNLTPVIQKFLNSEHSMMFLRAEDWAGSTHLVAAVCIGIATGGAAVAVGGFKGS